LLTAGAGGDVGEAGKGDPAVDEPPPPPQAFSSKAKMQIKVFFIKIVGQMRPTRCGICRESLDTTPKMFQFQQCSG
jgi:hypothetical protein